MPTNFLSTKSIFEGFLTFLPGLKNLLNKNTGGTNSGKYCYSGCEAFTAIDAVQHFKKDANIAVLHDIHRLFRQKQPVPGQDEFPLVKPLLDTYAFPFFLTSNSKHITVEYKEEEAEALKDIDSSSSLISFLPAHSIGDHKNASKFDLVFSQAVLEHVDDLPLIYAMCTKWLKPGGLMSHTIDFKCHGVSSQWNGHWTYLPFLWRVLLGRRAYFINRKPLSYHLKRNRQNNRICFSIP